MGSSTHRQRTFDDDGKTKKIWRCLAPGCQKSWNGTNSTKALAHGSKIQAFCNAQNIAPCKGVSSAQELALFTELYNSKLAKKNAKKRAHNAVQVDIAEAQDQVAEQVKKKKKLNTSASAKKKPGSTNVIDLVGDGGRQPSISTAIDRSTIDGCNAADLHTAIGAMIYCMGLSFNFAENPYF
ncbi:hypothetical protein THAOC_09067, partial [Thalassiosira oceanica]